MATWAEIRAGNEKKRRAREELRKRRKSTGEAYAQTKPDASPLAHPISKTPAQPLAHPISRTPAQPLAHPISKTPRGPATPLQHPISRPNAKPLDHPISRTPGATATTTSSSRGAGPNVGYGQAGTATKRPKGTTNKATKKSASTALETSTRPKPRPKADSKSEGGSFLARLAKLQADKAKERQNKAARKD